MAHARAHQHCPHGALIGVLTADIERWLNWSTWDIIVCLSVLPYIKLPIDLLNKISIHSREAIIECQYVGDGPGFDDVHNDNDMKSVLGQIWANVTSIGETEVKIRDKWRTVWHCTK